MEFHAITSKHLDKHAPTKLRRVKSSCLPDWYTPEIDQSRIARDECKRLRKWAEYKGHRNQTRYLIRKAKCRYFTNSFEHLKDIMSMWKHLRSVNNGSDSSDHTLQEELVIDGEQFTDSQTIAVKLNEYFTSIARKT